MIISETMKTIHESKKQKQKQKRAKRCLENYIERVKAKWFCCAFELGFFRLICKVSLIFKLNLKYVSSIILKEK